MAGQGEARVPLLCPWSGVRGVGPACITAGCGPEGPGAPGFEEPGPPLRGRTRKGSVAPAARCPFELG